VSTGLSAFSDAELDADDATLLVLPGDAPLIQPATLCAVVEAHRRSGAGATVLTAEVDDPTGYGRVIRTKSGEVSHIVEQIDASPAEREVTEVNTGIYCFGRSVVGPALRRVRNDNLQGEWYLTDIVAVLREAGYPVAAVKVDDPDETAGVNDRIQLAWVEAELRRRVNNRWLAAGVTMVDPATSYIDTTVQLAPDVTVFPNTLLQGDTVVGEGAEIGPDTHLVDCRVGPGARVSQTVATDAEVGAGAVVGPFAALSPGATIDDGARTGPFYTAG
jgi:bifunctional UDP-N-acetylglucosamine pyrophosphorylase/glucosamine-1-phosphate N-acetyltransferase